MVLLNFYNQQGAGPAVISGQFLNHLPDSGDIFAIVSETHKDTTKRYQKVKFVILPTGIFLLKFIVRLIYIPLLLLWLSIRYEITRYIVFGNFSLLPIGRRKIILVHHPYLFNISAISKLPIKGFLVELIKYLLFRIQIILKRDSDIYVVQSEYMRNLFKESLNSVLPVIIPNPLRQEFTAEHVEVSILPTEKISLAYISRFYPHKNHVLLFDIVESFRKRGVQINLYVTVNKDIVSATSFLSRLEEYPEIVNVGEIDHYQLADIYRKVDATLFLSDIETFGNPIIESLAFLKPVIGVDREYLKILTPPILHDFFSDEADEIANNIINLFKDQFFYKKVVSEIRVMNKGMLRPAQWVSRYLEL